MRRELHALSDWVTVPIAGGRSWITIRGVSNRRSDVVRIGIGATHRRGWEVVASQPSSTVTDMGGQPVTRRRRREHGQVVARPGGEDRGRTTIPMRVLPACLAGGDVDTPVGMGRDAGAILAPAGCSSHFLCADRPMGDIDFSMKLRGV